MKKPRILVVEDEESLTRALALNLELNGYFPITASTGHDALRVFGQDPQGLDLVLLDVMLPGLDGFDVLKEIRLLNAKVPVIFLTARGQASDRISGLKLGADDYVVKPFDLEELLLRVQNALRRNAKEENESFSFGSCSVNFVTYQITDIQGRTLTLSKREIGLLKLLTANVNKVISRDEIINTLWEPHENASSRTIDNYILSFRKLFESNPKEPRHFHSVRGVGYKFTA